LKKVGTTTIEPEPSSGDGLSEALREERSNRGNERINYQSENRKKRWAGETDPSAHLGKEGCSEPADKKKNAGPKRGGGGLASILKASPTIFACGETGARPPKGRGKKAGKAETQKLERGGPGECSAKSGRGNC